MHRLCWNTVRRETDAPPERWGKIPLGNAEMRDVPETKVDNKDSKDQMKVNRDRCSKSNGAM